MKPARQTAISRMPVESGTPAAVPGPPGRGRRLVWVGFVTVLACVAAAALLLNRPAPQSAPVPLAVRTNKVRQGTVEKTLRLTGSTAARNFASLLAPYLPGRRSYGDGQHFHLILQKLIKPGSIVKKGDIVAEFDRQHMIVRLDDYKANALQHELYLGNLNAFWQVRRKAYMQRIRVAKSALDKASLDLKTAPVRSAIQVEKYRLAQAEAKLSYEQLSADLELLDISEQASIRRMELDLRETRMELKRAESNLDRMSVKAPIDGLTVMLTTNRGTEDAEIAEGDQLHPGRPFMNIVDLRSLVVQGSVNQVDAEQLRIGQRARVRLDAYPGLELPGRLESVGVMARGGGWRGAFVKEIPVRLRIEGSDPRLIPNFSVSADVVLASEEDVAVVPRESVFYESDGRKPFAFARADDGWQRRDLELGLANHVEVAVHAGLVNGEEVAAEWPPAAAGSGARRP